MRKGKTSTGYEFEFDETKLNDMRVLDYLDDIQSGDVIGFTRLIKLLMSPTERAKLYSYCTDDDGKVSIERVAKEFFEIIKEDPEAKK